MIGKVAKPFGLSEAGVKVIDTNLSGKIDFSIFSIIGNK